MGGKSVMAPELTPAMSVPVRLPLRGRHAPVGRVDKTVTGLPDQAPEARSSGRERVGVACT
jgi:hypothetical protein